MPTVSKLLEGIRGGPVDALIDSFEHALTLRWMAQEDAALEAASKLIESKKDAAAIAMSIDSFYNHGPEDLMDSAVNLALELGSVAGAGMLGIAASAVLPKLTVAKDLEGIDQTTRKLLEKTIRDAMERGEDIPSAITELFDGFSIAETGMSRAEIIALGSIGSAYNLGILAEAIALAGTQKSWDIGGEACEICVANANEGWIFAEEVFSSGDSAPPAHPRCDCGLSIRTPDQE